MHGLMFHGEKSNEVQNRNFPAGNDYVQAEFELELSSSKFEVNIVRRAMPLVRIEVCDFKSYRWV